MTVARVSLPVEDIEDHNDRGVGSGVGGPLVASRVARRGRRGGPLHAERNRRTS
jgi:hypothetical protein